MLVHRRCSPHWLESPRGLRRGEIWTPHATSQVDLQQILEERGCFRASFPWRVALGRPTTLFLSCSSPARWTVGQVGHRGGEICPDLLPRPGSNPQMPGSVWASLGTSIFRVGGLSPCLMVTSHWVFAGYGGSGQWRDSGVGQPGRDPEATLPLPQRRAPPAVPLVPGEWAASPRAAGPASLVPAGKGEWPWALGRLGRSSLPVGPRVTSLAGAHPTKTLRLCRFEGRCDLALGHVLSGQCFPSCAREALRVPPSPRLQTRKMRRPQTMCSGSSTPARSPNLVSHPVPGPEGSTC